MRRNQLLLEHILHERLQRDICQNSIARTSVVRKSLCPPDQTGIMEIQVNELQIGTNKGKGIPSSGNSTARDYNPP